MTCKKGDHHPEDDHPEDDLENSLNYADLVEEALDTVAGRLSMLEDHLAAATSHTKDRAQSNKISNIRGTTTGARLATIHAKSVLKNATRGIIKIRDDILAGKGEEA